MASQLVPRVFCVTAVPKPRDIFACMQALVHGVVLKRKQPPIAAVNGGLWNRIRPSGPCPVLVRLLSLSGWECNACAQALVQDTVLKRKQALLLSKTGTVGQTKTRWALFSAC